MADLADKLIGGVAGALVGATIPSPTSEVAQAIVSTLTTEGLAWFRDESERGASIANELARTNLEQFQGQLGEELGAIIRLARSFPVSMDSLTRAFSDPAACAFIRQAIIAAAQTDLPEKHRLLARLLVERLHEQRESLIALVSPIAAESITRLQPRQLYILGFISFLYYIRPSEDELTRFNGAPSKDDVILRWYQKYLDPLLNKLNDVNDIDLAHLVSTKCLEISTLGSRNLSQILQGAFGSWDCSQYLITDSGKKVVAIFGKLQRVSLTSVGQYIGILISDLVTEERTALPESWTSTSP